MSKTILHSRRKMRGKVHLDYRRCKELPSGYMAEYWTRPLETRTQHISHIHFKRDMNNNKMERLNGEIRDREKVMRGLKKMDTPILKGCEIFHNYLRPHMGLEGKTPS